MMWANVRSLNDRPSVKRHPEAPKPGEEVMYVDLERERLENLLKD